MRCFDPQIAFEDGEVSEFVIIFVSMHFFFKKKFITLHKINTYMDNDTRVRHIRELISESKINEAIDVGRIFLTENNNERALVQLDMVESEWSDIRAKSIAGVLKMEDELYLQNVTKAKLMELILHADGDEELALQLHTQDAHVANSFVAQAPIDRSMIKEDSIKNAVKNGSGMLLFVAAFGAFSAPEKYNIGEGLAFIFSGLICFIPTLHFIEKSVGYKVPSWIKYALVIGGVMLGGYLSPGSPVGK
jgi:hypothetical protein